MSACFCCLLSHAIFEEDGIEIGSSVFIQWVFYDNFTFDYYPEQAQDMEAEQMKQAMYSLLKNMFSSLSYFEDTQQLWLLSIPWKSGWQPGPGIGDSIVMMWITMLTRKHGTG